MRGALYMHLIAIRALNFRAYIFNFALAIKMIMSYCKHFINLLLRASVFTFLESLIGDPVYDSFVVCSILSCLSFSFILPL